MAQQSPRRSNDQAADALAAMTGGQPQEASDIPFSPDDVMAAPAPDASVFAPKQRTTDLVTQQRLHTRRTAIPILLTTGLLLPIVGSLRWLAPEDSPFAQWEIGVPIALLVVGLLMLVLAVVNMRAVASLTVHPAAS